MDQEQKGRTPEGDFDSRERAAAATHLALLGSKLERMPDALRERIEANAHAMLAERSQRSTD